MPFYNFQNNFLIILSESDPSMLGFQESAMKLEDSISDFRKILSLATKTTSDFRNPDRKRARRGRIEGTRGQVPVPLKLAEGGGLIHNGLTLLRLFSFQIRRTFAPQSK